MSSDDVALYQQGRGPLTSNVGEGGVFLSTRGNERVPDCQFFRWEQTCKTIRCCR
jgi:hypothetical protein